MHPGDFTVAGGWVQSYTLDLFRPSVSETARIACCINVMVYAIRKYFLLIKSINGVLPSIFFLTRTHAFLRNSSTVQVILWWFLKCD